jgi:aubergine
MFDQPVIQKWGIFYQSKDHSQAKTLVSTLEKVLQQFDYQAKPMAMFPVQGNNLEIWRQEIISKVRADVQVVILLIPGNHGNSQLYHDLKKLMLRAIVSKLLAQICAKIGGIPWTIEDLPFSDRRTMVCGLDVYHENEENSISMMGLVASYNRTVTKYWTATQVMDEPGQEVCHHLAPSLIDALNHFKEVNGSYPE